MWQNTASNNNVGGSQERFQVISYQSSCFSGVFNIYLLCLKSYYVKLRSISFCSSFAFRKVKSASLFTVHKIGFARISGEIYIRMIILLRATLFIRKWYYFFLVNAVHLPTRNLPVSDFMMILGQFHNQVKYLLYLDSSIEHRGGCWESPDLTAHEFTYFSRPERRLINLTFLCTPLTSRGSCASGGLDAIEVKWFYAALHVTRLRHKDCPAIYEEVKKKVYIFSRKLGVPFV